MYTASENRYETMPYNRLGKSGLKLSAVSLGLWHNFGDTGRYDNMRAMCFTAFDNGITHFDLANNYGPPYGEAERNFGVHMLRDWKPHRDELIISSKPGPILFSVAATAVKFVVVSNPSREMSR